MILKRINCNDKFYKVAYDLYQNSFPYLERRDDNGHNWVMQKCDYNFTIIEENGEKILYNDYDVIKKLINNPI